MSTVLAALLWVASPTAAQDAPAIAAPATETEASIDVPPVPEPSRRISLQQAFELARRGASDIHLAELAIERARAAERIALAALLPQVNASFSYTRWDQAVERMGLVIRQQDTFAGNVTV